MTDLTEQWKKGELPEGKYWVKYKHWTDTVEMLDYSVGLFLDVDVPIEDDRIEKVIAEVPDYVEWQNMVNCACEEHEANHRLLEENAELKELLKECRLAIYDYPPYDLASDKIRLMNKIDEVLK